MSELDLDLNVPDKQNKENESPMKKGNQTPNKKANIAQKSKDAKSDKKYQKYNIISKSSSKKDKEAEKKSQQEIKAMLANKKKMKELKEKLAEENIKLCKQMGLKGKGPLNDKFGDSHLMGIIDLNEPLPDEDDPEALEDKLLLLELRGIHLVFENDKYGPKMLKNASKNPLSLKPDIPYEFDNIPKNLMCFLCHKLMEEPTNCYKCSTHFCKACIEESVAKYKKCPKCSCLIAANMLKPISLDNEYENTIIPCKFEGCDGKFNLKQIREHLSECVFKEMQLDDVMNVPRERYDYDHDPIIKNRLISYLQKANKSLQEHFSSVSISNEEQFKMLKEVENKNFTNEILLPETIEIMQKFMAYNQNLEDELGDVSNKIRDTNSLIKKMLNEHNLE